ncbi:type II secretion system protein E, partial [mine drainage metagenome]
MATATSFKIRVPKSRTGGLPELTRGGVSRAEPKKEANLPGGSSDLPGTYITAVPPLAEAAMTEVEFLAVQPPYSFARLSYNERKKEYLYEVIEPQLSPNEAQLLKHLKQTLVHILGSEGTIMGSADKRAYLRASVENYLKTRGVTLSPLSTERINYYILRDFVGYGPVDVLIGDESIEDISCDGVEIPLYVFHKRYESVKTNVIFDSEDVLNSFVVSLGQRCGKQVSVSNPILDGTTPEGHRVQATYAREVTTRGAASPIRRFKEKPF